MKERRLANPSQISSTRRRLLGCPNFEIPLVPTKRVR